MSCILTSILTSLFLFPVLTPLFTLILISISLTYVRTPLLLFPVLTPFLTPNLTPFVFYFTVLTPFVISFYGSYTVCHFILRFLHHFSSCFMILTPLLFLPVLLGFTSVLFPMTIYLELVLVLMTIEFSYP